MRCAGVCRGADANDPVTSEPALVKPARPGEAREDPCRVYLGSLPFSLDVYQAEEALTELCGQYGEVKEVQVPWQDKKKKKRQRHNGFGFVTFVNEDEARVALEGLAGCQLEGRELKVRGATVKPEVKPAVKKPSGRQHVKIFVGSLPLEVDSDRLYDIFSLHGTVVDCKIVLDERGLSKGYGFVTYSNQEGADEAMHIRNASYMDGTYYEGTKKEVQRRKIIVNTATRWKADGIQGDDVPALFKL
ncbi:hypothetical protein CYMTET_24042 [Cymbomonas tetramitiformis]|uniref:RRM domain-containing protein n=1 Tax=Cymbomonas tetramitiformis TaxID=36881 RepID=A0AAE0FWN7_9CHLO|nr:hypothetical protein CYMTET_24042 [Cymbomonas tetramitiformis]